MSEGTIFRAVRMSKQLDKSILGCCEYLGIGYSDFLRIMLADAVKTVNQFKGENGHEKVN